MTRRQSNNHWSGGIAVYPAPKNSECKTPLVKFSPQFFGIKTASSSLKRAKLSMRSVTHHCWCNWRTFWRKNAVRSPRGSCSCMTMPWLTGHLQPRRNWPSWASTVLITHLILQIWPSQTTTCSLDWNNWKVAIFIQCKGHCCRRDLVEWVTFWIVLSFLQKLEQWAKKCIELCGEYVE